MNGHNSSEGGKSEQTHLGVPRGSRLVRNLGLLRNNPRLFLQKLATWHRLMDSYYRRRWNCSLGEWMIRYHKDVVFDRVSWMGIKARKMVLDAWVYQQIIFEVRPEFIIEIGNAEGGSTLYLAHLLDLLGAGKVIAVDIDHTIFQPRHPRIELVTGDSLSEQTLATVERHAGEGRGMVIHDGDHSRNHVLNDLRAYSRFVSKGGYLIVEDTVADLFRAGDGLGSVNGPMGAVEQFLREDSRFRTDLECEFFVATYNPRGFLKRVG